MKTIKATVETIERITKAHIKRYNNMLLEAHAGRSPGPGISYRVEELEQLLATWKAISAKIGPVCDLTTNERNELLEALQDDES